MQALSQCSCANTHKQARAGHTHTHDQTPTHIRIRSLSHMCCHSFADAQTSGTDNGVWIVRERYSHSDQAQVFGTEYGVRIVQDRDSHMLLHTCVT